MANLKLNYNYILEFYKIHFKKTNAYRINLYYGLISNFIWILAQFCFLFIINQNFGYIIDWQNYHFVFFFLFLNFVTDLSGIFSWGSNLKNFLVNGNLNFFLTKPKPVFLQYFLQTQVVHIIINVLFYFILIIFSFFLFLENIIFLKFLFVLFYLILCSILCFIIYRFFDSCSFFMKNSLFLFDIYNNINGFFGIVPFSFFKNKLKFLGFFLINVYANYFSVEFLFNNLDFNFFIILIFVLFFGIIFFSFLIFIFWNFGLKKYEAFN